MHAFTMFALDVANQACGVVANVCNESNVPNFGFYNWSRFGMKSLLEENVIRRR